MFSDVNLAFICEIQCIFTIYHQFYCRIVIFRFQAFLQLEEMQSFTKVRLLEHLGFSEVDQALQTV